MSLTEAQAVAAAEQGTLQNQLLGFMLTRLAGTALLSPLGVETIEVDEFDAVDAEAAELTPPDNATFAIVHVTDGSIFFTIDASEPDDESLESLDMLELESAAEIAGFRALGNGATATIIVTYFGPAA